MTEWAPRLCPAPRAIAALSAALAVVVPLATADPSWAVLVYERANSGSLRGLHDIVASADDGTATRTIARGWGPQVSPSGHRIAYFSVTKDSDGLYLVGNRGRHRRLLVRGASDTVVHGSIAWSTDERFLVVADAQDDGAFLVDVRAARATHISLEDFSFTGASFEPNSSRVAVCTNAGRGAQDLERFDAPSPAAHRLAVGSCFPAWGAKGLAFERNGQVVVRRNIWRKGQVLLSEEHGTLLPIDWSATGSRLLVTEWRHDHPRAVLLDLKPRRVTRTPFVWHDIYGLSRNGHEVLGKSGGNVIVATMKGEPKVLAYGAGRASWTK